MEMLRFGGVRAIFLLLWASLTTSLKLNTGDQSSIQEAASTIAHGMMSYYNGNASGIASYLVGTLPYPPYYWWESGAMWGGLVDYWKYTGDTTWVAQTGQALQVQSGPANNYVMPQQQFDEGNDDQIFWCLAAITAAEYDLPNPGGPSWAQLSENCFNNQISRWDTKTCNGGLSWQMYASNVNGLGYKNSISNGGLFQLSARLARFTGNGTYSQWANTVWDWMTTTGLMDSNYNVYDGANDQTDCTPPTDIQWTYNVGIFLYGAANMYDITGQQEWLDRTNGLVQASGVFFKNGIMYEAACEPYNTCNNDQHSFKGYLSRWMAKTTILVPSTHDAIMQVLTSSANGVASACSGGSDGVSCGTKWYTGSYDGLTGAGQELASLETVQSLLVANAGIPGKQQVSQQQSVAPAPAVEPSSSTPAAAPKPSVAVVDKMQAVAIKPKVSSNPVLERQAVTAIPTTPLNATFSSITGAPSQSVSNSVAGSGTTSATSPAKTNGASGSFEDIEGLIGVIAIALGAALWIAC